MFDSLNAYFLFGSSSTILLILLGFAIFTLNSHHAAVRFIRFVACLSVWSAADVLELIGPTEQWCRFWFANIRTTAICLASAFWVSFCLHYARCDTQLWGRLIERTSLVIALGLSILMWSPLQHKILAQLKFEPHKWLWHPVAREIGPWYDYYFYFPLVCSLFGIIVLMIYIYHVAPHGRRQILLLVGGVAFLTLFAFLNGYGVLGLPTLDKSVFAMPVTVSILAIALFKHGFMRSTPVLLDALMNTIPDAILAFDHHRYLTEANANGLNLLATQLPQGKGSPAVLNRRLDKLLNEESDLRPFVRNPKSGQYQLVVNESDRRKILDIQVVLLSCGFEQGTLLTLRDQTRLYELIDDLNAYSTTVAHDLKNPLSAIITYCEVLGLRTTDTGISEIHQQILKAATTMQSIISDLLLVGQVEHGEKQTSDVVDVKERALAAVERFVTLREDAKIEIREDEQWPLALGKAALIDVIFNNLLHNALEHSNKDNVRIRIDYEIDGLFVKFSVTDNGLGIDPEHQSTLFCVGPKELSSGGQPRGFGLSIVRRLAEKQGGSVGVYCRPNEGATFWFTLRTATE